MTREEFYRLTDILNSEVLGNFMHGGEADELIAMFEEAVERSGVFKEEFASEDIEKEITDYFESRWKPDKDADLWIEGGVAFEPDKLVEFARHFANWQRQKDKVIDKMLDRNYAKGYDACKEQLMKSAVPATVLINRHGNKYIQSMSGLVQYDKFEIGDIVKVMFMKED